MIFYGLEWNFSIAKEGTYFVKIITEANVRFKRTIPTFGNVNVALNISEKIVMCHSFNNRIYCLISVFGLLKKLLRLAFKLFNDGIAIIFFKKIIRPFVSCN